ncbi:MAG: hypothetical protein SGPRY_003252 [Prymnesium sp.]
MRALNPPRAMGPDSPRTSQQDLLQVPLSDQPADVPSHPLARSYLATSLGEHSRERAGWRSWCGDLCEWVRRGGMASELSSLERRQKAQEWSNVFRQPTHLFPVQLASNRQP